MKQPLSWLTTPIRQSWVTLSISTMKSSNALARLPSSSVMDPDLSRANTMSMGGSPSEVKVSVTWPTSGLPAWVAVCTPRGSLLATSSSAVAPDWSTGT